MRSSTSPPRTSTPDRAARPMANEVASGVAIPSAHGQATTSTASAANPPFAGPSASVQNSPAPTASASTAGTKTAATRSATRSDGATARARLLDHGDDAAQQQILADALRLDDQPVAAVDGARDHFVARSADARLRLAGERRLLDDRASFEDAAVHRDPFAGPDAHAVADAQVADGHFARAVGLDLQSRARQQGFEAADELRRAGLRRPLDEFPERHQRGQHGRGVEVDVSRPADGVEGADAECREGADGDQRVEAQPPPRDFAERRPPRTDSRGSPSRARTGRGGSSGRPARSAARRCRYTAAARSSSRSSPAARRRSAGARSRHADLVRPARRRCG